MTSPALEGHRLGLPMRRYRAAYRGTLAAGASSATAGLLCLGGSTLLSQGGVFIAGLGLILLILGALRLLAGVARRSTWIDLHAGGLVYCTGSRSHAILWYDIESVDIDVAGDPLQPRYRYTIETAASRVILDNTFERVSELGEAIMQGYAQAQDDDWAADDAE